MANVIRQDVIQLGFDTDLSGLKQATAGLDDLKRSVAGVNKDDGLKKTAESAQKVGQEARKATDPLNKMGKTDTNKLRNGLEKIKQSLNNIGNKAAAAAYKGLKKVAGISFKALTAGVAAAAAGVGVLVKNAVQSYAEYEQLVGGVDTLFKGSSGKVQEYAANAYKTAGLSANDYMSTVTSFSASLIQSLKGDTAKAAEYGNQAVIDMGDNANKMGTNIESIQNAYQGFAKQNYTMLDNLKLGYGGTKEEMERLVNDAAKLDKTVVAGDLGFANITKAIHAVQENLGITGTTAKEASTTIQGSLSSMKAAWGNLMTSLVTGGDDFDKCVENMIETALTFKDNIMPAIEKALSGIGTLIERLAPTLEEHFPKLVEELLPPLLKAAVALVKGVIKALPTIIRTVIQELPDIIGQIGSAIGEAFGGDSSFLMKFAGGLLGVLGALIAFKKIKSIGTWFSELFGKKGIGENTGSKGSGLFGGFFDNLAKLKPTTILKAFANLAIIIGGMSLLAIAFAKVAPYIVGDSDFTVILKAALMVTAMGALGAALSKLGGIAGAIPVSTVSKGLANMAIMISGLTAVTWAMNLVLSKTEFDYQGMLKLIGTISLLGAAGMALTAFSVIAGIIPVGTVTKGLANMAIMIGGLTGVMWAMNWVLSAANLDFGGLLKIIGMISLLSVVGSVTAAFAAIVGMIPMPVVLAGLANLALVLGGLTGIIVAFGALTKNEGFNEFIAKGGEILVNIFNTIGKMAGALIGGTLEGIASSLPKIGESIAGFGEALKPMFEVFKDVDMSGIGTFFGALGSFLLQLAGDKLLSFFTGGTDLGELGIKLNTFAENAKGFFEKVATFPENGFTNATKLFECLSGLSNLPNSGGLKQWFQGEIAYDKIGEGLKALSGENVSGFFAFVQGVAPEAFDSAKKLFECLNGIGSLPSSGGLKQWFTGEVDYAKIAAGLESLSGEGVKKFFEMAQNLEPKAFENTTALFNSLGGINGLPSEGGFWQWLTGEKTSLSELADNLAYFGEKTPGFFEAINGLNLENLSGLWESLKGAEGLTADSLNGVSKLLDDLVNKAIELPKKMGDGIKEAGYSLSEALVHIWQEAAKAMADPVNKIIGGANWILKEFGSEQTIATWQPYAKGTDGHKGGNAMVNDGRGAELVQMPNGRMFIPQGRNVLLPNAPAGMKVLPAEQTAKLLGKKSPTFHYAKGIGDIDVFSYFDNASGLVDELKKLVSYEKMSGFALHAGQAMVSTITKPMESWLSGLFSKFQSSFGGAGGGVPNLDGYVASAGVGQWKSIVEQALKMEGQYSEANVQRTLYQMQTESSGNPAAINNWDSNAKKGTPSKGLMQVIDPTFRAYARPGFDSNIYDPLSNVLASIRYATSRYGSLANAYRGVGYANGVGTVSLPEPSGEISMKYTPENSYTGGNAQVNETNNYSPVFNLTINGSTDTRAQARQVKEWIQEAMNETFMSMARKARV